MFRDKAKDGTTRITGGGPLAAWPVGSIYMSINSTDPSELFGGTWERAAKGRVIVGVDESDSTFDSPGLLGGEKAHLLTEQESGLRNHDHGASASPTGTNNFIRYVGTDGGGNANLTFGGSNNLIGQVLGISVSIAASGAYNANQAHNNLQPYTTCYIWQRTA
jgi:hypothetical protein